MRGAQAVLDSVASPVFCGAWDITSIINIAEVHKHGEGDFCRNALFFVCKHRCLSEHASYRTVHKSQ